MTSFYYVEAKIRQVAEQTDCAAAAATLAANIEAALRSNHSHHNLPKADWASR